MLSVNQAIEKLKEAKVTSNKEVLRKWLRQGKIAGAFIKKSKRDHHTQEFIKGYKTAKQEDQVLIRKVMRFD